MLRGERLAVVAERDPRLAVADVLEREVGGVVAVGEREDMGGIVIDPVEERVNRDAFPVGVELRPFRDAVDVRPDLLARERTELLPGPRGRLGRPAHDRERPLGGWRVRRRPGREHREVPDDVLARGHARVLAFGLALAVEPPRYVAGHGLIPSGLRGW